jgi:hypothetical protein
MSFALQATLAGWHTHCMAGFDPVALRKVLHVPSGFRIDAVAAVGKSGDRSKAAGQSKPRDLRRERHPLDAMVFKGVYGAREQSKS